MWNVPLDLLVFHCTIVRDPTANRFFGSIVQFFFFAIKITIIIYSVVRQMYEKAFPSINVHVNKDFYWRRSTS